jgi:hypothetical protein
MRTPVIINDKENYFYRRNLRNYYLPIIIFAQTVKKVSSEKSLLN